MLALPWDPDAIGGVSSVVLGLYDTLEKDGRITPRILVASWEDKYPSNGWVTRVSGSFRPGCVG